ncbi:LytR/AlgR family response regulator transcription factor [Occallatibacter savannae]|uniref:LytR/AlgR family response regulator transcription factor n=1 Tax=Occallatibacter savannae TaxID=1002691 RepID=UPI000D689950|nr:LytTR family DNA-binding domain-containing protein [Occallatibacter savannae]
MAILTVIADDELLARQKLRQLLRAEADIDIAGEASSAREVYELVQEASPQLLFLDVRMPGMDGLDVIADLSMRDAVKLPRVILTTAYDQYALRAFELNATDYLLKPFTAERLHAAVERARDEIKLSDHQPDRVDGKDGQVGTYTARIVFKSRGRILFLPVADIRWISAEENYVRICTGTETHLLRETMTSLEQRLDPNLFLRVHRSAIVNLRYVKEVRSESRGDFMVHLTNGQKLAMSRSYRARIGELLSRSYSS